MPALAPEMSGDLFHEKAAISAARWQSPGATLVKCERFGINDLALEKRPVALAAVGVLEAE